MLGDDGNQMQADGNPFPVFSLGWTFGVMRLASPDTDLALPFPPPALKSPANHHQI